MEAPSLPILLGWHVQPVPVLPALALLLAVLYLVALWRLHRAGTRWPVQRTICSEERRCRTRRLQRLPHHVARC